MPTDFGEYNDLDQPLNQGSGISTDTDGLDAPKNTGGNTTDIEGTNRNVTTAENTGGGGGGKKGKDKFSLPGDPEIWKVGNKSYVVYTIPGTKPPIRLSWEIKNNKEMKAIFGPDQEPVYDREITRDQYKNKGVVNFGYSAELANFDEDPFLTWEETMRVQSETQPWLLDDDYQELIAMAMLEGRQLTVGEIKTTKWWKNHSQAEREWMKLYHGDPATAQVKLEDNRMMAWTMLRQAGVNNPSDRLVNFIADKVTTGAWSTTTFNNQILAISDPYSDIPLKSGVADILDSQNRETDTTIQETDTVRGMLREWLGPVHGDWSEKKIEEWAGRLRNDPDARIELENKLSKQRMALYKGYDDPSLTYEDIAQPWRSFGQSIWGQQMDETDPLFSRLIKNNDTVENGTLLRREGLQRNIGRVVQDAESSAFESMGGQVRRAYQ